MELVPIHEVLQDVLALLTWSEGFACVVKKRPEASLALLYERQNIAGEEVREVGNVGFYGGGVAVFLLLFLRSRVVSPFASRSGSFCGFSS